LVQQRLDVISVDVGLITPVETGVDEFFQLLALQPSFLCFFTTLYPIMN
jgi:hypothetical protein